ncbi:MAG: hypothetical protein QOG01_721 [Pseudonocardiales bacterium]|jgi:hypothetical protein|nr:hypothetical protein [Pseudonocardiales bacterium]
MTGPVRVHEDGQPIDFTYEAILDYHGRSAPAGVAPALKVMERAFPLLDPSGPLQRREITIATAFADPGARDAFEAVTRAVHLSYRGKAVHLRLRPGHVSEEFIDLARANDLSAGQAGRLHPVTAACRPGSFRPGERDATV